MKTAESTFPMGSSEMGTGQMDTSHSQTKRHLSGRGRASRFLGSLLCGSTAVAAFSIATPASAEMGLEPGAPQQGTMAGGVTPGVQSQNKDDWRFDYHGFFTMPMWVGFGEREDPQPGQSSTTWHAPPVVPSLDKSSFSYTNVMPLPWAQMNFSYGTSVVRGTVILQAATASSAQGFYNPPDHIGIGDAFLTFNLGDPEFASYNWNVGVYTNRYGAMGEYDEGQYATPIMARVQGAGTTLSGRFELTDTLQLQAEAGIAGNIDKPVLGTIAEGWNGFNDANVGSTYAGHAHLGVSFDDFIHVTGHAFHTFSRDDEASVQQQPDASMNIFGGDFRLTMGPFGHLYAGASYADAEHVQSLGGVVRYLNTRNGPDLMRNYLGVNSDGTGNLTTFGVQYDFSLASALLAPEPFSGNAPDVRMSAFFMQTMTDTDDNFRTPAQGNRFEICSRECRKYGGELTYKPLSFLAVAVRGDQVDPNISDSKESFTIVSPRVIFSSDWNSQDQVTLQYSKYFYGSEVAVRSPGYDPRDLRYVEPDGQTFSLHASMWW